MADPDALLRTASRILLDRIGSGDAQAEEDLVKRFGRGLSRMLHGLTRDPHLVEDISQETFLVVLEKARRGAIREPEKLLGFLRGTARRIFFANRRKALRHQESGTLDDVEADFVGLTEDAPQLGDVLRHESAGRLRRLLRELRFARDREILVRFYFAEDTKEEICCRLAVPPEHFKKVLFHARQRLRHLWQSSDWSG